MIRERRRLAPKLLAGLLTIPAGLALVALTAFSRRQHDLLAGGPIMLVFIYLWLVLVFNGAEVEVDAQGFRLTPGPLPAGSGRVAHSKSEVKAVFPQHVVIRNKYGIQNDYYASVELEDGRWVAVRGPYKDWAGASAAAMEIVQEWKFDVVAQGRTGNPPKTDWATMRPVLLWAGAVLGGLIWGVFVEILGLGH